MPKPSIPFRSFWDLKLVRFAGIAAVFALLAFLAVLQYQWIGQVSVAERERLKTGLQESAQRVSQDFNAEIVRILRAMSRRRPEPGPANPERLAEALYEWSQTATSVRLAKNFYYTSGGESGIESISRFNTGSGNFEPTQWPGPLLEWRKQMEERLAAVAREERPVPQVNPAILVVPRVGPRLERVTAGQPPFGPQIYGWVICELDMDFLKSRYLPNLVRRHLRGDYDVEIASRANPDVLFYRSNTEGRSIAKPDVVAGMYRIGPDFGRFVFGPGPGPGGGPGPGFTGPGFRGRAKEGDSPAEPRPDNQDGGRWELRAAHRTGSLEIAVEQLRRKNLAVSLGVLLLMASSIAMLVVTTRRAQRLARLQMEFVAGVSHELRTPLSVICSAGDNLADGLVMNEDQIRRYGGVIRDEGRRLVDMVEQTLRFASLQSGRAKFDVQPVDAVEVIDRALKACQPAISGAGIRLEEEIEERLPPVMADPTALSHCLTNLISNAVKYGGDGRWLGIGAVRLTDDAGEFVEIRVSDRGRGIDEDELPHIFEPFYRGQRARSDQIHGTGMGLNVVKRIVEAHAGTIAVESEPGAGTNFRLRIPVAGDELALWDKEFS
jgi:signal transduction histidine kinase